MADGALASGTHYRAFLSYSHRDEALAGKIHRRLESYRLPKNLVGTETPRGPVPAKLSPIFRDREELSAGESLSDRIRAALEDSDSLIVLCSPHAKASHWVSQEIRLFRELHPDRPVLAALIEGEPEEAFPDQLTEGGAEPIAPDFRKGKDGFRLALLKLVAGISGVPLDALVQRDAQRQLRRVTAITGGALVAVLIMSLLLVTAVRAQREAERQRAEAEGLVEYMLTDLRDRLKGVGRLDVMGAVNDRAMRYYGEQGNIAELPLDSLDRRARILHAMGEDDETRGNLDAALLKFSEAHRATAAILARRPTEPKAILSHGQSEYWIGYVRQLQNKPQAALAHYRRFLGLAQQAAKIGQVDQAERDAGWANNALGVLHLNLLDAPTQALGHFTAYRNAFARLEKRDPRSKEHAYSHADAYGWMADASSKMGNLGDAARYRQTQIVMLERLLGGFPADDQILLETIAADRALFRICYKRKDNRCAAEAIGKATRRIEVRDYDKANRRWLRQDAYVALDAAYLHERLGNDRQALRLKGRAKLRAASHRQASPDGDISVAELERAIALLQDRLNGRRETQ